MDWSDAAAGTGGGLLVAIVSWLLSRSDGAAQRRQKELRAVASELLEEKRMDIRLNTLETMFPQIQRDISEVKETVCSTNDKLDQLLLSGRLTIKKD